MNDKNSRVIPPGQFGSPFFEPSLSMGSPEPRVIAFGSEPIPDFSFFERGAHGGTDMTAALDFSRLLQDALPSSRFDRFTLVITDGEPVVDHEAHGDVLATLIASLKPGEQLLCLDYSGAQPPFPGEDAPRVIASCPLEG